MYKRQDADKEAILKDVREALDDLKNFMDIGEATIEESQTEDKDWINNWKQYFHQFYVDDILIVPSWEEGAINTDTVMVHVRNIREKIELDPKKPKYLKVVWGVGYKIEKLP